VSSCAAHALPFKLKTGAHISHIIKFDQSPTATKKKSPQPVLNPFSLLVLALGGEDVVITAGSCYQPTMISMFKILKLRDFLH